jgi:hypothetical protein
MKRLEKEGRQTGGVRKIANAAQQWATPSTMDVLPAISPEALARAKKKGGCKNLREEVSNWPTPNAQDQGRSERNSQNRKASGRQVDLPTAIPGKLNPRWVEALMGVPPGWCSPLPVTDTTTTSRTDELRLLGNGVVPAQAERAILHLLDRLL